MASEILLWGAAALVVACAGLEVAVRALQARRSGRRGPAPQALRDRFVAWRNNPAFARVDIQHNRSGFRRSAEVALRKPPDTTRIFLLGGSAIYGTGGSFPHIDSRFSFIHNHELIDAELERKLSAAFPSRRWEVINVAASGYRIHQQLALLQSRLLRYQPDAVILIDGYNDFIQLYHQARENPDGEFDVYENTAGAEEFDRLANPTSLRCVGTFADAWLGANSSLFRLIRRRLPGVVRDPWGRGRVERPFPDPVQLGDLSGEERSAAAAALEHTAYYAHTVRQIQRVLALDGIPALFLLQPILVLSRKKFTDSEKRLYEYERSLGGPLYMYLFRQVYAEFARTIEEAARLDGLRFVNLENAFDAVEEQCFSDFAHLTPAGNRVLADALFAHVRDSLLAGGSNSGRV